MLVSLIFLMASSLPVEADGWSYARWGMSVEALREVSDYDVRIVRSNRGGRINELDRLALANELAVFDGVDGFRFQVGFYFEGGNGRGRGGQLRLIRFTATDPVRCRTLQARLIELWGIPDGPIPEGGRIIRTLTWTDGEIGQSITYTGVHETAGGACHLTRRDPAWERGRR